MLPLLHQLVGGTFIAAGMVLLPLPIPLGALFLLTGVALVTPYNPATQTAVRRLRTRFPRFDNALKRWRDGSPGFIRNAIDKTAPHG